MTSPGLVVNRWKATVDDRGHRHPRVAADGGRRVPVAGRPSRRPSGAGRRRSCSPRCCEVFGGLDYTHAYVEEPHGVTLQFETSVLADDGRRLDVEGVDVFGLDDEGRIASLTVMLRPFSAVAGRRRADARAARSLASPTSITIIPSSRTRTGYVATGRYAGQRQRVPGPQVEAGAVPRAHDLARPRVPLALAERAVVVRAAVLDRVELAAAAVEPDRVPPGRDEPHRAVRQLVEWQSLDLHRRRGRYASVISPDEVPHSSGSGVPFARWSATLRTPRPRSAHLSRTGRERDADLLEQLVLRHRRDLLRCPALDEVGEHRRRRLADRAAAALEADVLDDVALAEPDRDRHLVTAERVLPLGDRIVGSSSPWFRGAL